LAFTLERYVFRQVLAAFTLAMFAMAGILLVGMASVMLRDGYSIVHARAVWKCLLLSSVPYAAPVALMCSVTLVFGRMSGDNELSAAASSGVRPARMAAPAWLLGLMVAGTCFWMNHWVLPLAQRDLYNAQERFLRMMILDLGGPIKKLRFWPYRICVEDVDRATGDWLNVGVFEAPGTLVRRLMRARRERCRVDERNMTARMELDDCLVLDPGEGGMDLKSVEKWLKGAGESGMNVSVGGPMRITLDVNLSLMRRRNMDSPELLTLPELWAEGERLAAQAAGMKKLDRPLSVYKDLSAQKGLLDERLGILWAACARAEGDLAEAKRQEEGRANALAGAQRRLAEARTWPEGSEAAKERVAQSEQSVTDAEAALGRSRERVAQAEQRLAESRGEFAAKEAEKQRMLALREEASVQGRLLRVRVELQRRTANAVSCLALVAAAMPLGALARKGSIIYSVAASLGMVLLAHYPLDVAGRVLACDGWVNPALAGWTPAVAVGALAAGLYWVAVRR